MFQKNFYQHEKECKQRIGVVFGGIDFYPLKKLSTITDVTKKFYTDWDEPQYQKYIKRFALNESKKFKELSNGMKVKYLLALALSHHAGLLILDEPLHGLDDYNRQLTREIISAFCQRRNKTMVMVTHYAEELPGVITDSLFLKKNK